MVEREADGSTARHRRVGGAALGPKPPRLSRRQWAAALVGGAALLGLCLVWTVRWDATESSATCTVSEMQRVLSSSRGASSVWRVLTDECGTLTIAYTGEGSGIAPSAVQPGSRYDFSLRGWEWLLYHRRIVAADRLG